MKANKLTQGHNLLWESSRMMLPEHKEVIQHHQKQINKKTKPILDEQQIEILNRQLNEAMLKHVPILLRLFDPYEEIHLVGTIETVLPNEQKIKFKTDGETEYLSWSKIIDVQFIENL